ncbi:MAG: hypothetical protein AAFU79_01100 [Myxococcota bacterium]
MRRATLGLVGVVASCLLACGEDMPGVAPDTAVADFALRDDNPTSPTAGQLVSPRDHLRTVSGWYFTHAT